MPEDGHRLRDFSDTQERREKMLQNHLREVESLAKAIQRGKSPRLERLSSRLQDLKTRIIPRDLRALEP